MNQRIKKLRDQSLQAEETISDERARLLTDYYKRESPGKYSVPVSRAKAFAYLLKHKELCINEGELIVGERGPSPKATPTYPEISTHTIQDLDILNDRAKISFKSTPETRNILTDTVQSFWQGNSIRDRIFEEMDADWKNAYEAGVFTEFMEQRAPGHTVLGDVIYNKGILDLKKQIAASMKKYSNSTHEESISKREELQAMDIAADALLDFAERYAEKLVSLALKEKNKQRRTELETMAENCRHIPARPPQTFWQALQYYWFVHLGVITELNTWDSFNPGRLDQHLYPFYRREIDAGTLTKERAKELLMSFWVKFNNQPAPPKVGVTAQESNTYTDFCLINVGGLTAEGDSAVNELSYLILDVIEEMRLLQPSSMVQISKNNPDGLLKRALEIIKTGYGQPSLFNTDAIIQEMTRQGKDIVDARQGGASGCVEAGVFGKESYILTGYFNLVKVFELTLNNGIDPRTKKQIGLKTGHPNEFTQFEHLFEAFKKQLNYFIDVKIKGNLIIEQLYAKYLPAPFLSIFIDDCIEKGLDYNAGGARYNNSYIQGVGVGTLTDSMAAIKHHVFDEGNFSLEKLLSGLHKNFVGFEYLHNTLLNDSPKYGNDDDRADDVLKMVFEEFFKVVDGRPNTKSGHFRINLLPTTVHIYFGNVVGATPDGREATTPLSEGISPVQGADTNGPTAVLKSAAKIDHLRTGGTLLNQKFTPQIFDSDDGLNKIMHLVRSYFRMDGHHIQFNVVTAETLRMAQKNPDKYKDLIVRVAGYSDYFVDLTSELQEEIIKRSEQII